MLVGRHRVVRPVLELRSRPADQAGTVQSGQTLVEEREQRRFVPRVADHERHGPRGVAPPQHVRRVFDHRLAVERRAPARSGLRSQQVRRRHAAHLFPAAELRGQRRSAGMSRLGARRRRERTAHRHGLVETALGGWQGHQLHDVETAGGLAEHGDVVRIAAEGADFRAHPAQRGDLVQQRLVAASAEFRRMQKAEDAEAVVHRHHHHIPDPRQMLAVDARLRASADRVAAAMNPHQHRPLAGIRARRPNVQVEAVFADPMRGNADQLADVAGDGGLHRTGPELERIAHARPRRRRFRGAPAQLANRRLRERNALEDAHALAALPPQPSAARFHGRHLVS